MSMLKLITIKNNTGFTYFYAISGGGSGGIFNN